MKRIGILVGAVAAASLSYAPIARAQVILGAAAGVAVPTSDLSDAVNAGYQGTISLAVGVPAFPIGLRAEGSYTRFGAKTGVAIDGDYRVISGSANIIYGLGGPVAFAPYLIGGLGAYNTGCTGSSCTTSTELGFNGGLGVRAGLGGFNVYGEARFTSVSGSNGSSRVNYIPITIGLSF